MRWRTSDEINDLLERSNGEEPKKPRDDLADRQMSPGQQLGIALGKFLLWCVTFYLWVKFICFCVWLGKYI